MAQTQHVIRVSDYEQRLMVAGLNDYYKIADIVRKYNKPIRYFAYASATKCAEQVVLEDQKRVKGS